MTPKSEPFVVKLHGGALVKNTIINFVGMGLPLVAGFVAMPFVIRGLGTTRFGILSIVWVVFGYFGIFDLGLGRTTTKYIAEALGKGEEEKLPGYLWTTALLQVALGVVALLGLVLAAPILTQGYLKIPPAFIGEAQLTLKLVAISLPINFLSSSFRGVLEAAQRFDLVNAVKIPLNVAFYVLPLAGVLLGLRLPGIVILLVASRIVGLAIWFVLSIRVFPVLKTRPTFSREYMGPLFAFSGWLALSGVLFTVISSLDRLFIGNLVDIKAVGYYAAPFEAISRLGIVPGSLSLVLFPAFSYLNGGGDREATEKIFSRSVKYLLVLAGTPLLLLIFFAKDFLRLWLGGDFALHSTQVVQFLALGFLVNCVITVAFNYLQGIGRVDITTKLQMVELVFYALLAWLCIRRWGIVGAAFATCMRLSIFTFFYFWASFKAGRIRFKRFKEFGGLRPAGALVVLGLGLLANQAAGLGIAGAAVLCVGFVPFVYYLSSGWAGANVRDGAHPLRGPSRPRGPREPREIGG